MAGAADNEVMLSHRFLWFKERNRLLFTQRLKLYAVSPVRVYVVTSPDGDPSGAPSWKALRVKPS